MRRVKDGAPSQVQAQWHRIWRLWRLQDILTHGLESERDALDGTIRELGFLDGAVDGLRS